MRPRAGLDAASGRSHRWKVSAVGEGDRGGNGRGDAMDGIENVHEQDLRAGLDARAWRAGGMRGRCGALDAAGTRAGRDAAGTRWMR